MWQEFVVVIDDGEERGERNQVIVVVIRFYDRFTCQTWRRGTTRIRCLGKCVVRGTTDGTCRVGDVSSREMVEVEDGVAPDDVW